ncbi:hypothetical protein AGABI2DRAFT_117451 [Agaricus bisporus var. bisporus H97]|uniref:hypothetical protein n=1 Tax=Agaricus bisporus var. bisporus (strain H97 / ATCC MYA-4626 / FGSC 10389) TaxID=936046 RepID=UPI00029F720C|nr:hypothetical protein AGABI2DRAFT_117451 [Agaricus bisporus var. bisporus H97]EKV48648.1 hypothetical protein AGABI2DRAFT_117451 [Agaricus bisporus var. bisporus H97]
MSPVKQSTTELFFPPNGTTEVSDAVQVPESLIQQGITRLTRLCLLLWTSATFATTVIVMCYLVADFGLVSPSLAEQYMLVNRIARLRAVEAHYYSLEQIDQRLQIIESRLDYLSDISQSLPTLQLDTLPSRLEATEAHIQSLSTLLEGAHPRNVALWADGARHVKALTSSTYEVKQNGFFQYFWRTKDAPVPPSHVLNGAVTSYCWELAGSNGQFGARLSEPSRVAAFSILHAHRRTLSSVAASKAPKAFALWGLYPASTLVPQGTVSRPVSAFLKSSNLPSGVRHNDVWISLMNGTYDQASPRARQYFNISSTLRFALSQPIDVVVLEILDNWGSNTTCLYGFGVHVEPIG